MNKKLYALCIGAWFVLFGLAAIFHIAPEQANFILGLLAIAGGILLVLDR